MITTEQDALAIEQARKELIAQGIYDPLELHYDCHLTKYKELREYNDKLYFYRTQYLNKALS